MALEKQYDYKIIIGARRVRVVVYEDGEVSLNRLLGDDDEARNTEIYAEDKVKVGGTPRPLSPVHNGNLPKFYVERKEQELRKQFIADKNYRKRVQTRREAFCSLVYNNFAPPDAMMITLTFDPSDTKDYKNLDIAHKEFKKFIQRMNYNYDNFYYVGTFSRQDNENWHYHIICNLNRANNNKIVQSIWNKGRTWVNYIETDEALMKRAQYCTRNMAEYADTDLHKEKGYLSSKGLQKNIVFRSWGGAEEAKRCAELLEEISREPRKIQYTRKKECGVKELETSGVAAGRILYSNDTRMEFVTKIESREAWVSSYYYINCQKKFPELFHLLPAATRKK